jgi:spore protease
MAVEGRSDLARECCCEESSEGVRVVRTEAGGHEILRVQIKSEEAAKEVGKPCGRYVTVSCGKAILGGGEAGEELRRVLAVELREMAQRLVGRRIDAAFSILVVGLGNAALTPDALGPQTVRNISVTRGDEKGAHAWGLPPRPCCISALATGVSAQTGLETAEIVRGLVSTTAPDLVVAVDELAARDPHHLAATVQLSDTGIQPGSGIGGARPALTEQSVGVPVLAIGVPTVVETGALVRDALSRFGIREDMPAFSELVGTGKSFFVTPKEIDLLLPMLASLLAGSIEKAFTV